MRKTKFPSFGFVIAVAIALDAASNTGAAQYCAEYNNGSQNCGIPSLSSCQDSVRGVGGFCVPDTNPPRRIRRSGFPPPSGYPDPRMPPPPFR
jgi:hypothetical protein